MLSYEEEKERKRRLRLLYHTEEEVKALEAKDFEVEKNNSKEQKKKEEFKALSFAEIRNMDNKQRREYAR